MSAPLAGKFQDHYEVLGVEVSASLEEVQAAYDEMAQQFHPDNLDTGDPEKFDAIGLAYEVLSQPDLRKEFDRLKGVGEDSGAPKFGGLEFFDSLGRSSGLRSAVLCILYDRRRNKPSTPGLSMRQIEGMLAATSEEFTFVLWYLKQRSLVSIDDKSNLQISVEGMDFLENNPPSAETVMPLVRPSALAGGNGAAAETELPAAPPHETAPLENESRRQAVNRILSRGAN